VGNADAASTKEARAAARDRRAAALEPDKGRAPEGDVSHDFTQGLVRFAPDLSVSHGRMRRLRVVGRTSASVNAHPSDPPHWAVVNAHGFADWLTDDHRLRADVHKPE
jgi:hypothetical protein